MPAYATREDMAVYPLQLAHLASDPELSQWIDEDAVAAFVADALDALGPFQARTVEAEISWLDRVYAAESKL